MVMEKVHRQQWLEGMVKEREVYQGLNSCLQALTWTVSPGGYTETLKTAENKMERCYFIKIISKYLKG